MSRKFYILILFVCILPQLSYTQPAKDSLQLLIETAPTDSARAIYHNQLAGVLFYENVDSALYHAVRAQKIAQATGMAAEEAQAHYAAAVLYSVKGNREEQLFHLGKSLQLARQIKDSTKIHSVIVEQALILIDNGRMAEALQRLQQSLDYTHYGGEDLLYSLYYIAALHFEMGNDSLGLAYEQRVVSLLDELNQPLLHTRILIQTGRSMIDASQWAKAESRLQKGLEMATRQGSNNSIALALKGLAEINMHYGHYEQADNQLEQSLELCLQDDFKPVQLTVILTQLKLMIETQQYRRALQYYQAYYPGVASFRHSNDQRLLLWSCLKTIYRENRKLKPAFEAQDSILFYQTLQLAEEEQKAVASQESEYQLKLEKDQRDALALETQKQELAISERQTLLIILTAVFMLVAVVAALFFTLTNLTGKRYERKLKQSIARDTAELRKVNQKLKDVQLRLESFFRIAATQLKAPLQSIRQELAYAEPRQLRDEQNQAKEYHLFLEKGVQQMEKLIEGIQAFADVHNKTLNTESINLAEATEDIFSEAATRFPDKKTSLKLETPLPVINGPGELIRAVLAHLIPNAIHFTPGDNVTVLVGYRKTPEVHEIWVKDYGSGIEPEFQERIFDLFYRLQDRGQSQNPGIGLPLSQKLAQQMNGALRVKSAPGMGSTFTLSVPVQ
ncbi:sensor histidine kinase [Phaeodactylibacter xiamenensis]|uniref:sensor histidine kinase n=1 Tax=Phaeodactylibacter xiamenensis TaxID=1524460 RepID=UPI003BA8DA77